MRSSCSSSMFKGIRLEPTNKQFNSAYLQIKYLISRKLHNNTLFTFFRKKDFLKTKKSEWDFWLDPPAKPAKQKKKVALEKLLSLHTRGSPAAAEEAV